MESFAGREAVNALFTFEAVVRAKRDDVKAPDLAGKNVDITLVDPQWPSTLERDS